MYVQKTHFAAGGSDGRSARGACGRHLLASISQGTVNNNEGTDGNSAIAHTSLQGRLHVHTISGRYPCHARHSVLQAAMLAGQPEALLAAVCWLRLPRPLSATTKALEAVAVVEALTTMQMLMAYPAELISLATQAKAAMVNQCMHPIYCFHG